MSAHKEPSEKFLERLLDMAVEAAPREVRAESDRITLAIKRALDSASDATVRDMSMLRAIRAWRADKEAAASQRTESQRRVEEALRSVLRSMEG